ncbi:hypothetical protein STENM327S_01462 [Streptomyces tendae]
MVCLALIALLVSATTFGAHAHQHGGAHADKAETVLLAGVAGLITYMVVGGLSGFFEQRLEDEEEREQEAEEDEERAGRPSGSPVRLAGKAAFFMFLYLEVLDTSVFDAVRQLVAGEDLPAVGEGVDVARLVAHPALVLVDVDAEGGGAGAEPPQDRCDRTGGGRRGGHLPAGDRAGRALSRHGGLVALAHLLAYLLGGSGLRLLGGGEGRRLGLSCRAILP